MYFHVVFALQGATISTQRLRSLSSARTPRHRPCRRNRSLPSKRMAMGKRRCRARSRCGDRATANQAPPGESQRPERAKAKGGHRPGTGRLGARCLCRCHACRVPSRELSVGQRCPVCGQGNLYAAGRGGDTYRRQCPAQCHALRAGKAALLGVRGDFYGGTAWGVGDEKYSAQARAVLAVSRVLPGGSGLSPARLSGDAGGASARCDTVGSDRGGG